MDPSGAVSWEQRRASGADRTPSGDLADAATRHALWLASRGGAGSPRVLVMGGGDQQGRSDSAAFAQVMKLYRDDGFDPIVWPGTSSVDLDVVFDGPTRRPSPRGGRVRGRAVAGGCLEVEGAKSSLCYRP